VEELLESVHLENAGKDMWISSRYILEELAVRRKREQKELTENLGQNVHSRNVQETPVSLCYCTLRFGYQKFKTMKVDVMIFEINP
jgi:hypothetical protein